MNPYFGFLFARPSFTEGVARALDLGGTLQEYNAAVSGEQADALALSMDWRVLGDDLLRAMEQLGAENDVVISADLMAAAQSVLDTSGRLELGLTDGS